MPARTLTSSANGMGRNSTTGVLSSSREIAFATQILLGNCAPHAIHRDIHECCRARRPAFVRGLPPRYGGDRALPSADDALLAPPEISRSLWCRRSTREKTLDSSTAFKANTDLTRLEILQA